MSLYTPVKQTELINEAMFSEQKLAEFRATSVLTSETISGALRDGTGQYINIPALQKMVKPARIDVTSATPLSPTAAASNDGKVPILTDAAIQQWTRSQSSITGANFLAAYARSGGDQIASRTMEQIGRMLIGAIPAIDSGSHLVSASTSALSINLIRKARLRMSDAMDKLTVGLIHPVAWDQLVQSCIALSSLDVVAGAVIRDGRLGKILGISTWIISADIPSTGAGFSTDRDDLFTTFLLGPGAIHWAYPDAPVETVQGDVLNPSTRQLYKIEYDMALGLRGAKFTGSANPSDSDFGNSANWASATEDHRNVLAVAITHRQVTPD